MVYDGISLVSPLKLPRKKPKAFLPEPSTGSHKSDGKKNRRGHAALAEKRKSAVKHKDGRGGPETHPSEKRADLPENVNQRLLHAGQPQDCLRPVPCHSDGGSFQARRRVGYRGRRNWTRLRLIGRPRVAGLPPA